MIRLKIKIAALPERGIDVKFEVWRVGKETQREIEYKKLIQEWLRRRPRLKEE